jgi:hypothetical protein
MARIAVNGPDRVPHCANRDSDRSHSALATLLEQPTSLGETACIVEVNNFSEPFQKLH